MALRYSCFALLLTGLCTLTALADYGDDSYAIRPQSEKIDEMILTGWKEHGVKGSSRINDLVFMRRIFLDVAGTIPTGKQSFGFIKNRT